MISKRMRQPNGPSRPPIINRLVGPLRLLIWGQDNESPPNGQQQAAHMLLLEQGGVVLLEAGGPIILESS